MTADKPSPFVPKLRFSEFRDAPDWEEVSLGTLLVRAPDYGVNAAAVPFSETLPTYIRITDINSDGQFAPCPRVSVDSGADEEQYLRDGDIVLARTGASVGKSYRYREEDGRLVYAGFLIRVRPNPQRLLSQFLAAYLSAWSYWDWVRLTSARSGQPGINGTEYASMPLPLPPNGRALAEQKKIADCLGSLDDLIAAEGRKLEALRQHKQGLMQQLFPQSGETVPRLRFPEFREAGEWEERLVGDVFKVTRGEVLAMPLVRDSRSNETPFPVYSSQTKNRGLAGYYSEYLYEDAITWTTDGANAGDVNYRTGKFYCTNVCGVLINNDGQANLCTAELINSVSRQHVSFVGNPKLMNGVMSKIAVPFPKPAEQQRIATCLSSLEDVLAAQARKIDALKQQKQGLLQQLFPSLETE